MVSVCLYLVRQVLYLHHYAMAFANTSNISIIFEFINISNIINVNIVADRTMLVTIESVGTIIFSFISSANIIETSKKLRKMMLQEEIQLALQEKVQNISNSYIYNNINSTRYSLDAIHVMNTGIKGFGVIGFDLQPIHLIVVLLLLFDSIQNDLKKKAN